MILYNSDYEFVGISDSYIKKLNFPSFNALKYRIGDNFANLFIEKKGFLYNFKYLSWIDYILQNSDKAQAILKGGDNSFYKVRFSIEPYFFVNQSEKGYFLLIESMVGYEMDSFDIDNNDFKKSEVDEKSSYYIDEDEYQVSNEDNFEGNLELSFDDSPTFTFESEVADSKALDLEVEKKDESHQEPVQERVEEVILKKNIQSPEEFLKSFNIEKEDNETSKKESSETLIFNKASKNFSDNISNPLTQQGIDKLVENGIDFDMKPFQTDGFLKNFESNNYIIDEVAKELEIKKDTLIDFLIDFIHHTNHLKPYIYYSLKHHNIKHVKNAIFMLKGLSYNLRINDIYQIFEKIYSSYYRDNTELSKDINLIYEKIINLNKHINNGGETLQFENNDVRSFISEINKSTLPDILFQDMVDGFIKIFDSLKDKIEGSLNPDKILELKPVIEKLSNISKPLDIDKINFLIDDILNNINGYKIEFDKLIFSWIELSSFVEKLK